MDNNIVISTRIRLARNLKDYPFPCRLSDKGKAEVDEKVRKALTRCFSTKETFIVSDILSKSIY